MSKSVSCPQSLLNSHVRKCLQYVSTSSTNGDVPALLSAEHPPTTPAHRRATSPQRPSRLPCQLVQNSCQQLPRLPLQLNRAPQKLLTETGGRENAGGQRRAVGNYEGAASLCQGNEVVVTCCCPFCPALVCGS